MTEIFNGYCPLDCPDVCAFKVYVEDGQVKKLSGSKDHPYTNGFVCGKGQKLVERMYSPDRITHPMKRVNDTFQRISWEQAYDEIAKQLTKAKENYGPTSVLHFSEEGSAGVLRALEKRFFNAFGGATFTEGSLCWGAVCGAQKADFGQYRANLWEDMLNSKTIILWGRNIAVTNIHMVPFVRRAQQNGATVVYIDPNKTQTAGFSDLHLQITPKSDGALALGLAYVILKNGWAKLENLANFTNGFEDYLHIVQAFTPEVTARATGLTEEQIISLAKLYAKNTPACIWLGYGMQRYNDSGQTVRAIDALGIIAGNVGINGGGVNHASQYSKGLIQDISGDELPKKVRIFKKAKFAESVLTANPPIQVLFVNAANPVTQLPNTKKTLEAMHRIPFKVVSDFFLTDTARLADIILPCASVFEKEDVIMSSWNPFIGYNKKLVEPRGEAKPDYVIYEELAKLLALENFPKKTPAEWLQEALQPAKAYGITVEDLQKGEIKNPLWKEVAWGNKEFATTDGKFNFIKSFASNNFVEGIRLLTSHPTRTMHSQFYNIIDDRENFPIAHIPLAIAEELYLRDMEKVQVQTEFGELIALVKVSEDIHQSCVMIHEGSWLSEDGGVNQLTGDFLSDLGDGTSYNEIICKLQKIT